MHRRHLLLATIAIPSLVFGRKIAVVPAPFDAVVTHRQSNVAGTSQHRSIADAIAAAPAQSKEPFRILVDDGVWHEKLIVDTPNVHLVGRGRRHSTIRFDAAAGQRAPDGQPWGTWGCATLRVTAPGFSAHGLTIENGFDYLGHLRNPQLEGIGSNGPQAVALMLDDGSDGAHLERCNIRGHQDTLFVDAGRSLFRDCTISGSVDFIFGAGHAAFAGCDLISRHRPGKLRQGYIAAPSTRRSQRFGLVFVHCRLLREADVPDASVALGRAWRPTRDFPDGRYGDPEAIGAAAFIECDMDAHVAPAAWDPMNYTARDGQRLAIPPEHARFCEYANRGPGARLHPARMQLSRQQADRYLSEGMFVDVAPDHSR